MVMASDFWIKRLVSQAVALLRVVCCHALESSRFWSGDILGDGPVPRKSYRSRQMSFDPYGSHGSGLAKRESVRLCAVIETRSRTGGRQSVSAGVLADTAGV